MPNPTTTDTIPYAEALAAANLPAWLRSTVRTSTRRKTVGMAIEPGSGEVVFTVPAGSSPAELVTAVQANLGRLAKYIGKQRAKTVPTNPVKEFVNGEGFPLFGTNHKVQMVDDSDADRRCGCACRRPITAHPGVPIVAEPGHSTWSGSRTYQLTIRRDAASAQTVVEWYRAQGAGYIAEHAPQMWARLAGTPDRLPTIRVRTLDPRAPHTWGTYRAGTHTISVHWAVFQLPREYVEYVLVHELAHAAQPKGSSAHGPEWQRLVGRLVIDWQERRRRLNEEGAGLWWGHVAHSPGWV